jgi:hypothetical protein
VKERNSWDGIRGNSDRRRLAVGAGNIVWRIGGKVLSNILAMKTDERAASEMNFETRIEGGINNDIPGRTYDRMTAISLAVCS